MMCKANKFLAFAIAFTFIISSLTLSNNFTASAQSPASQQDKPQEKPQDKKPPAKSDAPQDDKQEKPIVLNADLVMLDVTVYDQSSNLAVMNLAQKDFQVLEDKV